MSKAFIRPLFNALVDRACLQAKAADQEVITGGWTQNIELDELYSFAGEKHPDELESDLEEVGQHWTHVAMARESRLILEVLVGPRTQESATELVEGAARRPAPDCWPLWSSDGWEPYLFALTLVFAVLIHFIFNLGKKPKRRQCMDQTGNFLAHRRERLHSERRDRL